MTVIPLSPTLRNLFADLVQQVQDAPEAGSVYQRRRDGIAYIYAKVPVGRERIDVFLGRGEDSEVRARARALRQGMSLARERRRTVAALKSAGLAGPDRTPGAVLDALAHAGLFERGAAVVGTLAYLLAGAPLGTRLPRPMLTTGDLDLATVDVAPAVDPAEAMVDILRRADASFEPVPQLDPRAPASRFRNAEGYFVDLVVETRHRDEVNPVPLPELQAGAAPLLHLSWLIADPIRTAALWGPGVPVRIPQPARLAVHKLILAQRRSAAERGKRAKDLDQAASLMEALRLHDPFALEDALEDARAKGRKGWKEPIDRSLAELKSRD